MADEDIDKEKKYFSMDESQTEKKCPVCGENFNTRVRTDDTTTKAIIGVSDDATLHRHDGVVYVHK